MKANDSDARRTLAYAQTLLGDPGAALSVLAERTSRVPNDHPARLLQARCEAELGNHDAAIRQLQALVGDDPRNIDAWYALGKYSIQAGDAKLAVDEYLSAPRLANRLNDKSMRRRQPCLRHRISAPGQMELPQITAPRGEPARGAGDAAARPPVLATRRPSCRCRACSIPRKQPLNQARDHRGASASRALCRLPMPEHSTRT
jgi:tetratricopeptide (TPR) repeat protein